MWRISNSAIFANKWKTAISCYCYLASFVLDPRLSIIINDLGWRSTERVVIISYPFQILMHAVRVHNLFIVGRIKFKFIRLRLFWLDLIPLTILRIRWLACIRCQTTIITKYHFIIIIIILNITKDKLKMVETESYHIGIETGYSFFIIII